MNARTVLNEQELQLLQAVHTPEYKERLQRMIETGEGMTEEVKNDEAAQAVLRELLQILEETGIGDC